MRHRNAGIYDSTANTDSFASCPWRKVSYPGGKSTTQPRSQRGCSKPIARCRKNQTRLARRRRPRGAQSPRIVIYFLVSGKMRIRKPVPCTILGLGLRCSGETHGSVYLPTGTLERQSWGTCSQTPLYCIFPLLFCQPRVPRRRLSVEAAIHAPASAVPDMELVGTGDPSGKRANYVDGNPTESPDA